MTRKGTKTGSQHYHCGLHASSIAQGLLCDWTCNRPGRAKHVKATEPCHHGLYVLCYCSGSLHLPLSSASDRSAQVLLDGCPTRADRATRNMSPGTLHASDGSELCNGCTAHCMLLLLACLPNAYLALLYFLVTPPGAHFGGSYVSTCLQWSVCLRILLQLAVQLTVRFSYTHTLALAIFLDTHHKPTLRGLVSTYH